MPRIEFGVLLRPTMMAPASLKFFTNGESSVAMKSLSAANRLWSADQ